MKRHLALLALLLAAPAAWSQTAPSPATTDASLGWQLCAQESQDPTARLACYDRWARQPGASVPAPTPRPEVAETPVAQASSPTPDCHSGPHSTLSRYWELEAGSDCGRFTIRGYKPISLSWVHADSVNRAPTSPLADHTATVEQPYRLNEMRIQLSIRTKIASGLLPLSEDRRDSLWFGYTQQSYWQIFAPDISRPFRTTDHEPEFIYIAPTPLDLAGGWRLRYTGLSLNHQSNGQTLPLSRSWNRAILMAGMEKDDRYTITARAWKRISDGDGLDDNPDIEDFVGRAELTGSWQVNRDHTLSLTVRHSLRTEAKGSWRLEWLRTLDDSSKGLRLHVQLFSGYGDSLVDYNRARTLLSVGLSLVDW